MKKKEFMLYVKDRFSEAIKELDSSSRKKYIKNHDSEYNISGYNQVLRMFFKTNESNDSDEESLILNPDFSGKYNGKRFHSLIINLGDYERKENGIKEHFSYYEIYNGNDIISLLCNTDDLTNILKNNFSISKNELEILLSICDYSKSIFKPLNKKNVYKFNWLEYYTPSGYELTTNDINTIKGCKNHKLFFSILGYAILAFLKGFHKGNGLTFCPINIITDTESEDIVRKLIAHCIVRCGETDYGNIIELNPIKNADIKFVGSKGRLTIINTTKSKTDDRDNIEKRIRALMPNLYPYLEQSARKIKYEYKYLPIFISRIGLGSSFINIDAKNLNPPEWKRMYSLMHKLYEYPIYCEYLCKNKGTEDELEKLFVTEDENKQLMIYNRFQLIYNFGKGIFVTPYNPQNIEFPKNYSTMQLILWSCCGLLLPESNQIDDNNIQAAVSLYKSLIDRTFIPNDDLVVDLESQFDCDQPQSELAQNNLIQEKNFDKVLKFICNNIFDSKPNSKDQADEIAFKHKYIECEIICFRENYFDSITDELSINNYNWNAFKEDCHKNNLVEKDSNNVKIDGKSVKFFALNAEKLNSYISQLTS